MRRTVASKGFTLVELLVVIVIIGVLSSIILVNLSSSRARARDAQRVSDVGQLQSALEYYYDRCQQYPASPLTTASTNGTCPSGITLGSFISQIPTDPSTKSAYGYVTASNGTTMNDYVLSTTLEYNNPATAKGLNAMPSLPSGYSWGSPTPTCQTNTVNYCITYN